MLLKTILIKIKNRLEIIHGDITLGQLKCNMIYDDDRSIYQITVNETYHYIYKTKGHSPKSINEFEDEFLLLETLWNDAKINGVSLHIPQPIMLIEKDGILMTECAGRNLKSLYYESIINISLRPHVRDAIFHASELLVKIHKLNQKCGEYSDIYINRSNNLSRMIESILDKTSKIGVIQHFNNVLSIFKIVNSPIEKLPVSTLHGNFAMRNLLYDGTITSAIDLEDSRTDVIYYDLALLIAELLNKNIYIFNRNYNSSLIVVFIKSYTQHMELNSVILSSYVLYHLAWSYYEINLRSSSLNIFKACFHSYRKWQLLGVMRNQIELIESSKSP